MKVIGNQNSFVTNSLQNEDCWNDFWNDMRVSKWWQNLKILGELSF